MEVDQGAQKGASPAALWLGTPDPRDNASSVGDPSQDYVVVNVDPDSEDDWHDVVDPTSCDWPEVSQNWDEENIADGLQGDQKEANDAFNQKALDAVRSFLYHYNNQKLRQQRKTLAPIPEVETPLPAAVREDCLSGRSPRINLAEMVFPHALEAVTSRGKDPRSYARPKRAVNKDTKDEDVHMTEQPLRDSGESPAKAPKVEETKNQPMTEEPPPPAGPARSNPTAPVETPFFSAEEVDWGDQEDDRTPQQDMDLLDW